MSGLIEVVPTTAHIDRYIKIVIEKSVLRSLIYLANDISKEAYDDSQEVDDILESVQKSIFGITQERLKKGFENIDYQIEVNPRWSIDNIYPINSQQ